MANTRDKSLTTQAADLAESVLPALESAMTSAMDAAAAAKDSAKPLLEEVAEAMAPILADGKELAAEAASATKDFAHATVAKATPDSMKEESKGGGWKKWVLIGGLIALGAVVYQKLRGGDPTSDNWQSSYVPTPPPTPPAPADSDVADDAGGASPDEALADAVEEPHDVTTPDNPAEVVEIDGAADKAKGDAGS